MSMEDQIPQIYCTNVMFDCFVYNWFDFRVSGFPEKFKNTPGTFFLNAPGIFCLNTINIFWVIIKYDPTRIVGVVM